VILPVYKFARRVVVQSSNIFQNMIEQLKLAGRDELANHMLSKTAVISNGIYPELFQRSHGDKVVYVGRLNKRKGVADIILGMKDLPGHELVIVGDGPERDHLETMSRGLSVTFTGQVMPDQVRKYLQQARMLIFPSSLAEGFPNVVMEAMACGVPVVATGVGGVPELVQHSKTGFLLESRDISEMVFYMKRLFEDDQLWEELSENSIQSIQSFAWKNIAPKIEQQILIVAEQE